MTTAKDILKIAAGEIGYDRHTDPKKGTKYARETQPVLWPQDKWLLENGIPYCDIGVSWVFMKANAIDILPGGASYNVDYRYSKALKEGAVVSKSNAKPGDILEFDWNWNTVSCDHVGILEKVLPSGNFQTIEFNTTSGTAGNQGNGGKVARRVRRPDQVRYVLRPRYAGVSKSSASSKSTTTKPAVDKNGKLTVDGRLGTATIKAFQAFLNTKNKTKIEVDGKAGKLTWKAMQTFLKSKYVDGEISYQSYKAEELGNGITQGWNYTGRNSKGSTAVKNLQTWLGMKNTDGVWYEETTKALQKKLNSLK